jgi:signal peptidase I
MTLVIIIAILPAATVQVQSMDYERGELVRVQDVEEPTILRVVGLPNDRIRSDDSGLYVNNVAVTGFSSEFLSRVEWRAQVIPEGHYFVMGEQRTNGDISEYFGIHPGQAPRRVQ